MMNTTKGYEFTFEVAHSILRVRYWGFWDEQLGQNFKRDFEQKVREISAKTNTWFILVDITKFPPQSAMIQQFLTESMELAMEHGLQKSARLVDSAVTKLQFERLSDKMHLRKYAFFTSAEEARQWLLSE
jgi:hypothetical protein